MASPKPLVRATPAPSLNIPPSNTSVKVSIIDTTTHISGIPSQELMGPYIKGYDELDCPAFSFLVEHPSGRKILFDLGVRTDWWNLPPRITKKIKDGGWKVEAKKGVNEILEENGVKPESIDAIIWSHFHWDHTGDPSHFPPSTSLIVGPGFKEAFTPGYPSDPSGAILESDYASRTLYEINDFPITLGRFPAHDYFGDGSFYLLSSPGHAIGHMCGLARTTTSTGKDTFILMGGDACHHGGEFRPTPYLPLPRHIHPNPLSPRSPHPCPGSIFAEVHPSHSATTPFFVIPDLPPEKGAAHNYDEAIESIRRLEEFDCQGATGGEEVDVFTVIAHDESLLGLIDFFPKGANAWREKGWAREGRWAFLKDFAAAVESY